LHRVGLDRPNTTGADHFELHRLAERGCQECGKVAKQPIDIQQFRFERLAARKCQQVAGQNCGAVGADQRHVDGAAQSLSGAVLPVIDNPFGVIEIADDDRQKIIEVVRHAAGELADRVHLLRLIELLARRLQTLLCFAPLGGVAGDLGQAEQFAVGILDAIDDDARPETRAVLAHPPALRFVAAFVDCRQQSAGRHAIGAILRRIEHGEVAADDFALAVALDAHGPGVPVRHVALRIEHVNGVIRDAVNQRLKAPLAFLRRGPHQLPFQLLAALAGGNDLMPDVIELTDRNVRRRHSIAAAERRRLRGQCSTSPRESAAEPISKAERQDGERGAERAQPPQRPVQRFLDVGVGDADPDEPAGKLGTRVTQPDLITLNILSEPSALVAFDLVDKIFRRRPPDPLAGFLRAPHDHIVAIQNPGDLSGDDIGVDQLAERRQVDGHMKEVSDRAVLADRNADEINGMAGDRPLDDIADIRFSGRGGFFVVRIRIAGQRRSPGHARVGKLLPVAPARRNLDPGQVLDARGTIVKSRVIAVFHGVRSRQRLQGDYFALQIPIDVERQFVRIVFELLIDAGNFRIGIAPEQHAGERADRQQNGKHHDKKIAAHGQAAARAAERLPHRGSSGSGGHHRRWLSRSQADRRTIVKIPAPARLDHTSRSPCL
jgi:hypothetical protein